jgi:Fic family protein
VRPEAYVTNDAIDAATEWWTSPARTGHLRTGWGRRADCFLAATLLLEGGNEVTSTDVADITGMQENNVSTKLTDLVVLDVLRREVKNGRTYFDHSNWTKERLK